MTQQPFDPMDKLLREALASDALPPSGLTDRIMAQVERTPQGGSAASNPKPGAARPRRPDRSRYR